jgi:hypothetical protein
MRSRSTSPTLALLTLLVAGCAPPPLPPAPPPPAPAPEPIAPPAAAPEAWGTYRSARFQLELPLPDGRGWRIDDHSGPWLSATHAATESAIVVRSWTEDGRATRERCEEQARLWRTLPDPARADEVKARSMEAPAGFDTFVSVGVLASKPDEPVSGFAVAFGGHGHRCFAWAYTTTARGPGAGAVLGDRLGAMVERSLGRVVLESELSPRIPREPPALH